MDMRVDEAGQHRPSLGRDRGVGFERPGIEADARPGIGDAASKQARFLALAYGFTAFLIVAIAVGVSVEAVRNEEARLERQAREYAESLAQISQEHMLRNFRALDRNSLEVVDAVRSLGADTQKLTPVMQRIMSRDNIAVQIGFIYRDGRLLATSAGLQGAGIDLKDREHFKAHLDSNRPEVFISKPLIGRASNKWSVQYTRRITSESGEFLGVAVISFDPLYLSAFYEAISLGEKGVVRLMSLDGTILASSGDAEAALGKSIAGSGVFAKMTKNDHGTFDDKSPIDGVERLFAFRRVPGFPVIAFTGLATEDTFAGFRNFTIYRVASPTLTIFAVILLGVVLRKFIVAQRQAQDAELQRIGDQRRTEFLESVMRMSGAYVVVIDSSGLIRTSNEAFRRRFDDCDLVPVLSNLSGQTWIVGKEANSLSLSLADLPKSFETILKPGRNDERFIDWTFSIFSQTDTGVVDVVIGIGLDTTDRRRAQSEVYQSAKLATLGQMATGLAHEINQPLNVIQLTSENLRNRLEKLLPGNEDVRGRIEKIKRQVARMSSLVDHMRIFGRKSSLQMHLVDPASAIEDALAIFGSELRLAGIDVHKSFPNIPAFVVAESNLLEQILLNLLVNARDAINDRARKLADAGKSFKGQIELSVSREKNDNVTIVVADSAGGIPDEAIGRVFEPFFTTKPVGKGTGLGLSVSYGIVKDLGGNLSVRNGDKGAIFTIELPATMHSAVTSGQAVQA
jgi:signal transduction histidine kinase